jgi:hypothetical protein
MAKREVIHPEDALPLVDGATLNPFLLEMQAAIDEQLRADFIRKHIITGEPVVIDRNTYFDLRRRVAAEFDIHPSEVILVGSCRLGFSLKLKGFRRDRKRRYVAVTNSSDVDVAVVSQKLFDEIWDAVFHTIYPNRDWPLDIGKQFTRDLFNGWINPGFLPNTPKFSKALKWSQFFDQLTRLRLCGIRTINGRLYRTWGRLEAYQEHMVRECLGDLTKDEQ